ncbi:MULTISPECIES: hypothetical protein [Streptomyces]|uniref:hypothetical protein n=1 Tax=Streptomyces TaxID=1883 RepID=UPI000C6DE279|nr:hypothetical protein [Streptomyces barkulensis]
MRTKHSVLGLAAGVASLLVSAAVTGPAQAATPADGGATVQVMKAPPAPEEARTVQAQGAAATSPGISPSVRTAHVPPYSDFPCASGNLCTLAWDSTKGMWKVFYLYTCNRYHLTNWLGTGHYANRQTGSPTSYFYGSSGNVIKSFKPFSGTRQQDWGPVWSIRNC